MFRWEYGNTAETSRILIGCMLSDARSDCVAGRKYERVSRGVFHLPRNSGNSGWDVNGTHVFGSFHWKISGINGTSEKVVLFSRWKLSDGNVCSIYNF